MRARDYLAHLYVTDFRRRSRTRLERRLHRGNFTFDEPGSYIISFVATPESLEKNSETTNQSNKDYQWFDLSALKLTVAAKDELTGIELSADKTTLSAGDTAALTTKAIWTVSGEVELDAEDVEFTVSPSGVVEVAADGTVTAIGAGTATVTAAYEGKTATVDFTVAADTLQSIALTSNKTTLFLGGNKVWNQMLILRGFLSAAQLTGAGFGAYIQAREILRTISLHHIVSHVFFQNQGILFSHDLSGRNGLCSIGLSPIAPYRGDKIRRCTGSVSTNGTHKLHIGAGID